ncbi:MAG: hypothetical protein NWF01_10815 [Candidatus Bathyarchaeota archaeon]|nr:hypothetical protein [Candidatus Bathyarchaeota archaeon]
MNPKNRLQNHLRGWLPKEPTLQTSQAPINPKNTPMIQWTAKALVIGAVLSATFLVLGETTGLTGVGRYLWYATVEGTVWGIVAAVPFLVKRKTCSQKEETKWIDQ